MKQQKNLIHQFIIDESECLEEMKLCSVPHQSIMGNRGQNQKEQLDKVLKEYEAYVDRMIEEEWLGSDEDDWIEG